MGLEFQYSLPFALKQIPNPWLNPTLPLLIDCEASPWGMRRICHSWSMRTEKHPCDAFANPSEDAFISPFEALQTAHDLCNPGIWGHAVLYFSSHYTNNSFIILVKPTLDVMINMFCSYSPSKSWWEWNDAKCFSLFRK